MIKKLTIIAIAATMILLVSSPGCGTFTWDPTGVWTVTFNFSAYSYMFNEQLTFSGSESGGSVTGFTFDGGTFAQTGTWTKTGDYSLSFNFAFNTWGENININATLTSSEANPNSATGSGTDQEDGTTFNFNLTATKTSNLQ